MDGAGLRDSLRDSGSGPASVGVAPLVLGEGLTAQAGTAQAGGATQVGGGAGSDGPASAGGGPAREAEAASEGADDDMADDPSEADPVFEALIVADMSGNRVPRTCS